MNKSVNKEYFVDIQNIDYDTTFLSNHRFLLVLTDQDIIGSMKSCMRALHSIAAHTDTAAAAIRDLTLLC